MFNALDSFFKYHLFERNELIQDMFPITEDEILSENRYVFFVLNVFSITTFFYQRTNLLLAIGITWLGIITPCLQMIFANLYFRFGHIWTRVLNAELHRAKEEYESEENTNPFYALKYLLTRRVLH